MKIQHKDWVDTVYGGDKSQGKVYICVGGQYGSEAKGLVVAHLVKEKNINYAVRTGAINAGHTVYYEGQAHKNQQIPVGWINPDTILVIGAGAYINPEVLEKEIKEIELATSLSLKDRLIIDCRAGAHLLKHHVAESGMHERMGSTGEGCSAASKDKMDRKSDYIFFKDTPYAKENDGIHFKIMDTVKLLNQKYDEGKSIMLEGTQGTMLDLHMGYFPYCTSRQTIAANWLAEAGLSPNMNLEIIMVVRTYPIRVAGNSGPMPQEINWVKLAEQINFKLAEYNKLPLVQPSSLEEFKQKEHDAAIGMGMPTKSFENFSIKEKQKYSAELVSVHKEAIGKLSEAVFTDLKKLFEFTTVTQKLRRISELSLEELKYAISLNRPNYLVLNFLNYKFPTLYGVEKITDSPEYEKIKTHLSDLELQVKTPIKFINWEKDKIHDR